MPAAVSVPLRGRDDEMKRSSIGASGDAFTSNKVSRHSRHRTVCARLGPRKMQDPRSKMRDARCETQHATCKTQRATCNMLLNRAGAEGRQVSFSHRALGLTSRALLQSPHQKTCFATQKPNALLTLWTPSVQWHSLKAGLGDSRGAGAVAGSHTRRTALLVFNHIPFLQP